MGMERPPPLNMGSTDKRQSVAECDHMFVRLGNMRANATHILRSLVTVELAELLTKFGSGPGLTHPIKSYPGKAHAILVNSSMPKTSILAS